MKHKLITLKALSTALIAAAALVACQREAAEPQAPGEGILVEIPIALEQPGAAETDTKVDANLTTGVCGWTSGDQVAVYVSGSGANAYRNGTVNISNNTLTIDVEPSQTLANYAVYPAGFQNPANYSGATPGVIYPATYDFTGHANLSSGTYIMTPMMAVTGTDVMYFYHVGGMLRLALANVPTNAASLELTFVGMTNVCGTCTVTNPGTSKATTAITSGGGNVLTVTGFTRSETMYVNIPLPCGDYSSLTAIRVKVLNSTAGTLANVSKTATGWGTLKHGYARIVPVDFNVDALGSVKLSANTPVTLWKSQTIQRTAKALYGDGLPFADATMAWSSSEPSVATVNPSTGLVTAVGPGEATITVTATSGLDGSKVSDDYTVYVNAVTAISVSPNSYIVRPGKTTTITATLTNTNKGTVWSHPSDLTVSWSSSTPAKVTVASTSVVPVRVDATTMKATVTINGVAEGSSTITASVATAYASPGALSDSDNTVDCEVLTTITGGNGTFRGYYIAPGFLQYDGTYSLTPAVDPADGGLGHAELDGLASVMAAYGTAAGREKHYFQWATIKDQTVGTYHVPSKDEWAAIINNTPAAATKVGNTSLSKGYVEIVVNLSESALSGTGLSNKANPVSSAGDNINDGASITRTNYIAGLLLIPDGATIICPRLKGTVGGAAAFNTTSANNNCITYADLEILVKGGCVFLPAAGSYLSSSWLYGGTLGLYWSATEYTSYPVKAYHLVLSTGDVDPSKDNGKVFYFPVRLVR